MYYVHINIKMGESTVPDVGLSPKNNRGRHIYLTASDAKQLSKTLYKYAVKLQEHELTELITRGTR